MTAVIRVITLYLLNFLLTRGILPPELVEGFKADTDAMLALELGIAAILTVLFTTLWKRALGVLDRLDGDDDDANEISKEEIETVGKADSNKKSPKGGDANGN